MKRCTVCGQLKSESEYSIHSGNYLRPSCKKCNSSYYSNYVKNRIKTDKIFKEKIKKRASDYYHNHKKTVSKIPVVCKILKEHSDNLAEDDEHLSTEFIMELLGRKKR